MGQATASWVNRLPKSFPVGAVYVVEGRGGEYGRLRVSARYVVMPDGKHIDLPAKPRDMAPAPARHRLRVVGSGRQVARPKEFSHRSKKFAIAAGTRR